MRILAVDTSGGVCSAAVLCGGVIQAEAYMNAGRTHSETLGPMLDFSLSCAGIGIRDIELFACAVGPGSFTGLRIGIGMIKAFAHASGKPAIGINTLDALSHNAGETDEMICPIIDARRGEVYTAAYHGGKRLDDYRAVPLDDLLGDMAGKKAVFLGDAALKFQDKILALGFRVAHQAIALQHASSVGLLAEDRFKEGKAHDAYSLEPYYLRETQAERIAKENG